MRFFTHEFPTGKELRSNLEAEASQRGHSQDHSEFCSTHFFRLRSFVSTIQKSQFVYLLQNIIFVLPEAEERFVNCEADQDLWPLTKCLDVSLDRALGR